MYRGACRRLCTTITEGASCALHLKEMGAMLAPHFEEAGGGPCRPLHVNIFFLINSISLVLLIRVSVNYLIKVR